MQRRSELHDLTVQFHFTVDCRGISDVSREQLSQQLDSLLSSNLTYGNLTSLSIINTPLTHVPRSVCRLTTLTHLYLDNNQLILLPDDCFPHLNHLTILSVSRNKIQKLQNGLFDGLQELVSLNLSENNIFEIGLGVFSNVSDTISVRHIGLSYNNLTSIEPWPLVRGQLVTEKADVVIRLDHNRISRFTNEMRWKPNYGFATGGFLVIDLTWNRIRHIMDFADGWNFTFLQFLYFLDFHRDRLYVRVFFQAKSFACDCIDFPLYEHRKYDLFSGSYCSSENSQLRNRRITAVPKEEFVCELSERCPFKCRCVYRPANVTLHVYCSNTNLSVLPLELPALPKSYVRYYLDFSNNKLLRRLEHRDYFVSTSVLDTSNCGIDTIPLSIWNDILIMKRVCFDGKINLFKSLPPNVILILASPSLRNICLDKNQLLHSDERCPPDCWCVYRLSNATLDVQCYNTNLSVLPLKLPALPNGGTKYYLNFSNNQRLHRLEHRDYFSNTSVLDVSNCGIDEIPLNVWKDMSEMEKACLYGNPSKSLPANFIAIQLSPSLHNQCLYINQWLYSDERCPRGCWCIYRPENATLDVCCSNTNLSILPLELPALPNSYTKYYLNFSNNRLLRRLEHRGYFINTSVLDLSNCGVHDISLNVWKDILTVKKVLLNGNLLKSLPADVVTVHLSSLLSLYGNPWACSCENSWMSIWLHQINRSVINVDGTLCGSPERLRGKNIMKLSTEEVCHDPVTEDIISRLLLISLSSVIAAAVVLMSIAIILYRLRVKLYTTWKFHPFDRDECPGEDMDYDVFLSCSSDDNLPHGNVIRERLEQCGYRICYPPRDFVAGELIFVNIENSVVRSKRTVCLLTSHFLQR